MSRNSSRASTPVRSTGRSKLAAQIQQLSEQLALLSASSLDEQRVGDGKSWKKSSPRADSRERKRENVSRRPRDSSSEKEKRVASKSQRKVKQRTKPARESSASSSEGGEDEQRASQARVRRKMDGLTRREKFMRLLASYKLNFTSGDKTKAQLFLERAKEFRDSVPMTLTEFFDVMSFAFSSADSSDLWYRTHKRRFVTFADFETAFKNMYIGPCDEDDIMGELQHRVQGKNEPISEYMTFVRHLVMQLEDPPTEKKLAWMVWRNLRAAYRLVLNDECPNSIDTIESHGLKYERGRALDAKIEKSGKDRTAHADTKGAKVGALVVEATDASAPSGNASKQRNSRNGKKNASAKSNANANANANASASANSSANSTPSAIADAVAPQTTSSQPHGAAGGFIGACYTCSQTGHRASRCPRTKCYRCHEFGHQARECSMPSPVAAPSIDKCQFCGTENVTFLTCPRCAAIRQEEREKLADESVERRDASRRAELTGRVGDMPLGEQLQWLGQALDQVSADCSESPTSHAAREEERIAAMMRENRDFINVRVNGEVYRAMYDTRAQVTIVGPRVAEKLKDRLHETSTNIKMPYTPVLSRTMDTLTVQVEIDGRVEPMRWRAMSYGDDDIILGADFKNLWQVDTCTSEQQWRVRGGPWHDFYALNDAALDIFGECAGLSVASVNEIHAIGKVIERVYGESENIACCVELEQKNSCEDSDEYGDVCVSAGLRKLSDEQQRALDATVEKLLAAKPSNLGLTTLTEHHIDVQGAAPIKHHPRRMSPKMLEVAHAEVDKMLADGVIERSASAWSSAPAIVKKADGSNRFCIDYRDLNKVTKKDAYPVPNIDHILDKLRRARYITMIDLKSAYFQIKMEESSKKFTAFAIPGSGLYQFLRLPYGLCNAPASFQRLIDALFGPEFEPHVFGYLDDIIIVTESFDEHMKWLELVLTKLRDAGLTRNRKKCDFCCSRVKYLGYVLDSDGLRVDAEKAYTARNEEMAASPERWRNWCVRNGMLYRYKYDAILDPVSNESAGWKLVVPKNHRERVLREAHSDISSGHLGRYKPAQTGPQGLMGKRVFEEPWTVVAMDCMEFPKSKAQNKYLIVIIDLFTRWVEIRPVRRATAKAMVSALEELVVFRWGTPEVLITDNGTEFINKDVAKTLKSSVFITRRHRPTAPGRIRRSALIVR
ncbi:unnamed protein product [Trichogramma brassicae]|uniref:Uncharacterized protein n=1 Tax=Trichogramma brassicae TaxID=86971 RepID=A0A6H5IQM5_9HYME|nr:unnamed protein product [Trichogramma brassicae]